MTKQPDGCISPNWILRRRLLALFVLVLSVLALAIVASPSARAQTYTKTILHNFTGGGTDGVYPGTRLIMDKAGNLYGTTEYGGDLRGCNGRGCGVVFKVDASGKETVLHAFMGKDGAAPLGRLTMDAGGNLYGTTLSGGGTDCGHQGCGTIFKLDSSGRYRILYAFTGRGDGSSPWGGLLLVQAGYFFGIASAGGSPTCGCGAVFKLVPNGGGWTYTVLYRFRGISGSDGQLPSGELTRDPQGYLYGTTIDGGATNNGTVYKIRARTETVVYRFVGGSADGSNPIGGLLRDSAGNFYGTTANGGGTSCIGGCGTVFKLDSTGKESVVYAFTGGADGAYPYDRSVTDAAGNLYGTTWQRGINGSDCPNGCGTVFKVDTTGKESTLYSFLGGADGRTPVAGLAIDAARNLYGTTAAGGGTGCGGTGCGTVFKLTPH